MPEEKDESLESSRYKQGSDGWNEVEGWKFDSKGL